MKETKEVWVTAQHIERNGSIKVFTNYLVSNLGRVMSLKYRQTDEQKILKPATRSKSPYEYVYLYIDGKGYWRSVHRLVLNSFDAKGWFKKSVVDHIDSDPHNNTLSNLRYATHATNNGTEHHRLAQSKAHTNHPSKSKRVKVTWLSDGYTEIYPSAKEAGRAIGINPFTTSNCINKRKGYYRKLNLQFEYV